MHDRIDLSNFQIFHEDNFAIDSMTHDPLNEFENERY